jgi:hypothetical protein
MDTVKYFEFSKLIHNFTEMLAVDVLEVFVLREMSLI